MRTHTRYLSGLAFCLCAQWAGHAWGQPAAVPPQQTLQATLESGKPTPLDALTPYGKRELIRQMRWREHELVGFGVAPLIRELDQAQLAAILHFLDLDSYVVGLARALVGPPLRLPAPSVQMEQDLLALRQFNDEDRARRAAALPSASEASAPAVLRRYRQLFGARLQPATLGAQPLGDLVPLFDAATVAAQGNPASSALDDLVRLHRKLGARGIDTRRTLDDSLLTAMLAARRFDQARAFAAGRPHLGGTAIPQVDDPLGPSFEGRSAFAYDAGRNTLTRLALPAASTELVMVVSDGCHNSANALQAVAEDTALQARLRAANLVLVTGPSAGVETRLMARWNAAHPAMPILAPYSAAQWHGVDGTFIPAFYLLRNGKVVDRRSGWGPEGKKELIELIEAAAK
ncbi:hypothetical protein [Pseudoduganella buxea]|uniref:Thioredoxin domain-containing protein n=1 Tax=Pseudoduganella buxea TaxID=1949069 RepID=A0A6I3T1L6_9BURK|nr:hypothetical protein [Pseudoduganella buxea]MTV55500.1 hypothetical protein [Pseudoduganella buxea]GGB92818.1 hypothetical protein GCM10011572_13500 [Pseudoduganella buxea]